MSEYSPSWESIRLEMRAAILNLYSHFLHGKQEIISPSFYLVLNSFPNKLDYYVYYIFAFCLNSLIGHKN
jgi:hypothetical protein